MAFHTNLARIFLLLLLLLFFFCLVHFSRHWKLLYSTCCTLHTIRASALHAAVCLPARVGRCSSHLPHFIVCDVCVGARNVRVRRQIKIDRRTRNANITDVVVHTFITEHRTYIHAAQLTARAHTHTTSEQHIGVTTNCAEYDFLCAMLLCLRLSLSRYHLLHRTVDSVFIRWFCSRTACVNYVSVVAVVAAVVATIKFHLVFAIYVCFFFFGFTFRLVVCSLPLVSGFCAILFLCDLYFGLALFGLNGKCVCASVSLSLGVRKKMEQWMRFIVFRLPFVPEKFNTQNPCSVNGRIAAHVWSNNFIDPKMRCGVCVREIEKQKIETQSLWTFWGGSEAEKIIIIIIINLIPTTLDVSRVCMCVSVQCTRVSLAGRKSLVNFK